MSTTSPHNFTRLISLPLYPFLIGVLPAVHFYENNFRILSGLDLLRPILLSILLVGLFMAAGRLIWGSLGTAALILTPLLVVLFKGNAIGPGISIALTALTLLSAVYLRLRPANWPSLVSGPLNAVLLMLVLLPVFTATRASLKENTPLPAELFHTEISIPSTPQQRSQPDIYYFLVDALGQPDYIEENYPLPKEKYSALLTDRGFNVLRISFANYPQTALSAAATMNMAPVDKILTIKDPLSQDRRVLKKVAGNSRVARAFKKLGYKIISFPSGYPLTHQARADRRQEPFLNPSFLEYYLIEDGVLPLIQPLLGYGPADLSFALRRGRLNYIFDELPSTTKNVGKDEPVFVYTHILAPHPPFVFGPEGQALPSRGTFGFADGDHWLLIHGKHDKSYRKRYSDQATWIMHRLAETIDGIIASSPRPKIIIVQGDHGPGSGLDWERPQNTDHTERMGIFNAWYVSDGRQLPLYEGMSAINTFPVLFNSYFGTEIKLLADDLWFARMSHPYEFYILTN